MAKKRSPTRYTAADVLKVLAASAAPVTWRDLVGELGADDARSITQLRQLLKGLQRNDQIERDHSGDFYVVQEQSVQVGQVRRAGRMWRVDDYPLGAPDRSLRAGDTVEFRVIDGEARIMAVTALSPDPVIGLLNKHGRYAFVEAMGDFKGRVSLEQPPSVGEHGDTVEVRITARDRRGLIGVIEAVVEHEGVLDQAIQTAVAAHQLPDIWPDAVTRASERLPQRVNAGQHRDRVDLTTCPLVTIDGETAKDFDDAVFAEPLGPGQQGWRLRVAIADVGHYVKPGTPLDDEALNRGTSVYFPERVIPMLPEAISNGLCSLRPDIARLALVCEMQVDPAGVVRKYDFYEAVIHSHARLTYTQVQDFLDQDSDLPVSKAEDLPAVESSVRSLAALYHAMRGAREKRGALDFATQEGLLTLKNGRVTGVAPAPRLQAHQLIEEAMIAANVCAAMFLEDHEQGALYRVHEPPEAEKLEELRQVLAFAGVKLPAGSVEPAQMQAALQRLPEHANVALFSQLALRSLQQAVYTPTNRGHFGLALERYMHFTSPIRRYPDLIVHRAIKAVLRRKSGKQARVPTTDQLQALGELCSNNERRAESASWMVEGWLKCDFLRREIGNTLPGIFAGVTEFGLFVELEGYFVQGLLHISNLGSDYYEYHPRAVALVGEKSGQRFVLGDTVEVVVTEIDPPQGKIDLLLANAKMPKNRGRRGDNDKSGRKHSGGKQSGGKKSGANKSAGKKTGANKSRRKAKNP